ncbi:MAG: hypothetical protein IPJ77_23000 [Planctomycetes bacterium]|nr:hypothetical protein [Planctomycetota bacterium]
MKSTSHVIVRSALAALALGGTLACRATQADARADTGVVAKQTEILDEPPLYARDGTIVQGPGASSEPRHEVGARDGSRMYLLELYQKTVEEKEALTRETQSLHEAITRAGETQSALERERDAALAQTSKLSQELARAQSDNVDLSARLVTAQIRRLEAEKLLLEARIDALRREGSATGGTAIETSAPKSASAAGAHAANTPPASVHGGGHP